MSIVKCPMCGEVLDLSSNGDGTGTYDIYNTMYIMHDGLLYMLVTCDLVSMLNGFDGRK